MMAPPAYVLAGGRSSRMGRDKAFVQVEGRPMALRVAAALRDGGAGPVHLVGKDPALAGLGLPWVADPSGLHHPLVGAAAALDHAAARGASHALLCPTDLPWLTASAVAHLLAAAQPAVAQAEGRRQPLLALLPVTMGPALARAAEAGASVRAALAALPAVELPAAALRNVNQPGDLEADPLGRTC